MTDNYSIIPDLSIKKNKVDIVKQIEALNHKVRKVRLTTDIIF